MYQKLFTIDLCKINHLGTLYIKRLKIYNEKDFAKIHYISKLNNELKAVRHKFVQTNPLLSF